MPPPAAHPRAQLAAVFGDGQDAAPGLDARFDEFLGQPPQDAASAPSAIETYTQGCAPNTAEGPFTTPTWAQQHPGEVRLTLGRGAVGLLSAGNPAVAEPSTRSGRGPPANGCAQQRRADEPGLANYRTPAATGAGYTLLGSPTVIAKIKTTDPFSQVQARLWDVGTDGQQRFVTRAAYRPDVGSDARQVFQLHPNGWHFAAGPRRQARAARQRHPLRPGLERHLQLEVSDLELRLPVRETPDGGQICRRRPPSTHPPPRAR